MKKYSATLMTVTIVAAFSWGASIAAIWLPVDARALPDIRVTAATSAIGVMLLGSVRWLGDRAMIYLIDVMLTQRAQYQGRHAQTQTGHLRAVR